MSCRQYSYEEKIAYVEDFNKLEQSISSYAKENDIPESTFRGWLKEDENMTFGKIQVNSLGVSKPKSNNTTIVFACENIRIELKENFNKELLKQIMGVLINA